VNRDAFSKIIGRFDTRLSLSSANVDEVIKKRLLAKTEAAADRLRLVYNDKAAILKNLITFSQDTPEKRLYDSSEDFADVYPFTPYQFNILQAVFNGIRTHGASGKHLSEGERSLLNAFQEAAIFDKALKMLDIYEGNHSYVLDPETMRMVAEIEKITKLQSPYSEIYKLPKLTEQFMNRFVRLLEDECEPIRASVKADYDITSSYCMRAAPINPQSTTA